MEVDPTHWLWRLTAQQWIEAGHNELEQGLGSLSNRRRAVVHARRGAGMALNGVLLRLATSGTLSPEQCLTRWGRSYLDHLRVLARSETDPDALFPFDPGICTTCRALISIGPMPPASKLVQLSGSPNEASEHALAHAQKIIAACRAFVAPSRTDT